MSCSNRTRESPLPAVSEPPIHVTAPLFQRALGRDWHALPEPVQKMHELSARRIARGTASVERGNNLVATLIADLFGFPKTSRRVPVEVTFEPDRNGEIWTRRFGAAAFRTRLHLADVSDNATALIIESFGPLSFTLALKLEDNRLYLAPVAWRLIGIPLPMGLAPYGNSYEFAEGEKFAFNIEIAIPIFGLIVRYRGTLVSASG